MLTMRRIWYGGHGPPWKPGRPLTKRLAVVLLALTALTLEGCASWDGMRCGSGCGGGLFRGGRLSRMFRRDVIVTEAPCGEPAIAVPAAPVISAPGAIVPVPAPAPAEPLELTPAPPASESAAPTTKHSQVSPNQRTLYETLKPPGGTTTSRLGTAKSPASTRLGQEDDPLINLPPLSAAVPQPAEEITPPVPPAAETLTAVNPHELPPRTPPQPLSLTEGIARFKVVKPQVAGGSAPTAPGWSFLVEKGYRTILDLRPLSEAQAGDVAAANRAGLRYVLLTVTPETINDALLKQFGDELNQSGNKPLYFFDNDGSRAAVLWYLYEITVDQVDEATAAREVEELGPRHAALWLAATTYLESRAKTKPAPAPSTTSTRPDPAADSNPTAPASPDPQPAAPAGPAGFLPLVPVADRPPPDPAPVGPQDFSTWKPYAAMLVSSLTFPLGAFGHSALSRWSSRRASLPAPGPAPRSLPAGSDG